MHIVAIAWIYVVLMMAITERSVVAAIMTFLLYGVLPLTIILYLMGTTRRRRQRARAEKIRAEMAASTATADAPSDHVAQP
jgi:small-conductance mechanosensitive channel